MDLFAVDIMTHPVISANEDMTVRELIDLLNRKQISGVPVVDADDRLVGVISITDLISLGNNLIDMGADSGEALEVRESDFHTSPAMDGLAGAHGLLEPDAGILEIPVGDLMSRNVITAREQAHIGELADRMVSNSIHRLIIVRGDRMVGIISVRDILRSLGDRYRAGI